MTSYKSPDSLKPNETDEPPDEIHDQLCEQLRKRFPTTRSLFRHHSKKAKLRYVHPQWRDNDDVLAQIHSQSREEWRSIRSDSWTEAEWAELRTRLLQGRKWYLKSISAAHLFDQGQARMVRWDGLGENQNEYEFSSDVPSSPTRSETIEYYDPLPSTIITDLSKIPLTRPVYPTVKHKYKQLKQPKRTIFVLIPSTLQGIKPYQIADVCRSTLNSVQESVCEDAHIFSSSICAVRLRRENLARRLVGHGYISVKEHNLEVRPYPTYRPQVYVAQIWHGDVNGIRMDSLLLHIAKATETPFYAWVRHNENTLRTVCVIAFRLTHDLLCFDIDVQTASGWHVLAQFYPAARSGNCVGCRGPYHRIQQCPLLFRVDFEDVPEKLKEGKYLFEAPKTFW